MITQKQLHLLKEQVEEKHNIKLNIISSSNKCHKIVCDDKVLIDGRNTKLYNYLINKLNDNNIEMQILNIIAFCNGYNINIRISYNVVFTINGKHRTRFNIKSKTIKTRYFNTIIGLIKYMTKKYNYNKQIKYDKRIKYN